MNLMIFRFDLPPNIRNLERCELRTKNKALESDISDLSGKLGKTKLALENAEDLSSTCREEIKKLEAEKEGLKHICEEMKGEMDGLRVSNNELSESEKRLKKELETLKNEMEEMVGGLRKQNGDLSTQLGALGRQVTLWQNVEFIYFYGSLLFSLS